VDISKIDFKFVCDLVRRRSGIVLEAGKEYLVETRLGAVARRMNIASLDALIVRLRASDDASLETQVIEAMTTNETSFLRDLHPFAALKSSVLPEIVKSRPNKELSIWCGASSTGQEPYTIAMMLHEAIPTIAAWKLTFVATDLSGEMIARSKAGRYNQIEISRGLPAPLLVKYFDKQGTEWVVQDKLRQMIEFREMNLTTPWPSLPACDLIFMRNVLIYFDPETKKQILAKCRRLLRPDGYLFLGGAESTMGLDDHYERVTLDKAGVYRLKAAAQAA
jgi:chemotaxis protein methyltransferase CheR